MALKHWLYSVYSKMSINRVRLRQPTPMGRLVRNGALICGLVGLNTDSSLIYQLFALLICFYLLSRYTLFISRPSIRVRRSLPKYATANVAFSYRVTLSNCADKPEFNLVIVDHPKMQIPSLNQFLFTPEPFEKTRNAYDRYIGWHRFMYLAGRATGIAITAKDCPDIAPQSEASIWLTAMPRRRGLVYFASINVLHPDPFNLIQGIQTHPLQDCLLVFPRRYPLSAGLLLQAQHNGLPGYQKRDRGTGESDEFISIRDYRDGDSLKKIHWASSAKRGRPVVREFQDEAILRISILLDADCLRPQNSEAAISIAASLVHHLAQQNRATELICNETAHGFLGSDHGAGRQLEMLALLKPGNVRRPVQAFEALRQHITSRCRQTTHIFLVFAQWTDQHHKLIECLQSSDCPSTLLLITNDTEDMDKADTQITIPQSARNQIHIIPVDQIAEKLAAL